MRTFNIWNQFNLCGKKISLILPLLVLAISQTTFAQRTKEIHLPFYDERKLHFGFQLGGMMSKINLGYSTYYVSDGDTTQSITPLGSGGFTLGFILSTRLKDDLWSLRFTPTVAFYQRAVEFGYRNDRFETKSYENTFIELPVLLKYKSVRRGNTRMYMVGGLVPSFKVAGDKQKLDENQILTIDQNLEITYGLGFDLYFEFFKFAPELRFSHGIPNVFTTPNNPFTRGIDAVTTHRVSLFLNFE